MVKSRFFSSPVIVVQYFVLFAALIHSPLAELFLISGENRNLLIIAGLTGVALDLFYTGEFFIRSLKSAQGGGFKFYFYNSYGWVDFLNSIVMLLFVSSPYLLIVFSGNPDILMLKTFFILYSLSSSIRIVRILKFALMLAPVNKGMASRHTWLISCCVVAGISLVAFILSVSGLRDVLTRLSLYFSALIIVFIIRTFYMRHFEINVSHVIGVIDSGMRKKNYNLMAVINERYRDDEVFRLADYYNRFFLPAKMRQIVDVKGLRPLSPSSDRKKRE